MMPFGALFDDVETVAVRLEVSNIPRAIGRGEMLAVLIQCPLINPDGSPNPLSIFIGNATNQIWYQLPGQDPVLWYAEDQKDVYVRAFNPLLDGGIASLRSFAVVAGTGYLVGDVVTLTGVESGSNDATITVTQVSGPGGIVDFDITTPGTDYLVGEHVTGSGGSGINYENLVMTIVGAVQVPMAIYRRRKGGKQ